MEKRKRYILPGTPQIKYISIIVLSMLVPTLLVSACLYYLVFNLVAEQLGIPESIFYNLMPVIQKINLIIVISLPIIFILVLIWSIILTHRLIGPLYRLEMELDKIIKGDRKTRIRFRKNDELHSIANKINAVLDMLTPLERNKS